MSSICQKLPPLRLDPASYENLRQQALRRVGRRCQSCGAMLNLRSISDSFAVTPATIQKKT